MKRSVLILLVLFLPLLQVFSWSWNSGSSGGSATQAVTGSEPVQVQWNLGELELSASSDISFYETEESKTEIENFPLILGLKDGNVAGVGDFVVRWSIASFDPVTLYLGIDGVMTDTSGTNEQLNWSCSWPADSPRYSVGDTAEGVVDYSMAQPLGRHSPSSMGVVSNGMTKVQVVTEKIPDDLEANFSGTLSIYIEAQ